MVGLSSKASCLINPNTHNRSFLANKSESVTAIKMLIPSFHTRIDQVHTQPLSSVFTRTHAVIQRRKYFRTRGLERYATQQMAFLVGFVLCQFKTESASDFCACEAPFCGLSLESHFALVVWSVIKASSRDGGFPNNRFRSFNLIRYCFNLIRYYFRFDSYPDFLLVIVIFTLQEHVVDADCEMLISGCSTHSNANFLWDLHTSEMDIIQHLLASHFHITFIVLNIKLDFDLTPFVLRCDCIVVKRYGFTQHFTIRSSLDSYMVGLSSKASCLINPNTHNRSFLANKSESVTAIKMLIPSFHTRIDQVHTQPLSSVFTRTHAVIQRRKYFRTRGLERYATQQMAFLVGFVLCQFKTESNFHITTSQSPIPSSVLLGQLAVFVHTIVDASSRNAVRIWRIQF